jgi:hypothetical protein
VNTDSVVPDPASDDPDDAQLGDVPEGLAADLYPRHLEHLSRQDAYRDAVLRFADAPDGAHDVALDQVTGIEDPSEGSSRWKIRLRNGAIVLASGAAIAAAIAALRYRRRRE